MLKKSLSQHLIKDKNILNKIVRMSGIVKNDVVVEIGPGHGDLTRCIAEKAGIVHAIEIDRSFKVYLDKVEETYRNAHVIYGDFIKVPLNNFNFDQKIKIMGNIPYKITAPILFKLIDERSAIKNAHITVQREIAERIVSKPRRRTYGALSVILQLLSDVKILFILKPGVFIPPPKVDSALLSIDFKADSISVGEELLEFIKICFHHKRKYMKNSLTGYFNPYLIDSMYHYMGFALSVRAEEIEPIEFKKMFEYIKSTDGTLIPERE